MQAAAAGQDQEEEEEESEEDDSDSERPGIPKPIPVRKVLDPQQDYKLFKAKRCTKCCQPVPKYAVQPKSKSDQFHEWYEREGRMLELIADMPERQNRTIMRKIKQGKMGFDEKREEFIELNEEEQAQSNVGWLPNSWRFKGKSIREMIKGTNSNGLLSAFKDEEANGTGRTFSGTDPRTGKQF